jgi:sugar O-acyltransferase (sialic acid O-acetyltransferase NeuD family)
MSRLVIAGAGNLGREVASWWLAENAADLLSTVAFIDDTPGIRGEVDVPVIGVISRSALRDDDAVLVAIADCMARSRVAARVLEAGRRAAYFSRDSSISRHVRFGYGAIVMPGARISVAARIGDGVVINCNSTIGHDVVIGDWVTISSQVDICGRVTIGNRVFIGSGARIMPGLMIGEDAHIGAGSVVLKDVAAGEHVFGVPARKIT